MASPVAPPSTTARPADKGTKEAEPDATAVRMAVNGLSAVSGMRRKAARGVVLAYVSTGRVPAGVPLDGWAHWLRSPNTGRLDPTGETAAGPKTEARRRIAACGDSAPIWVRHREAWATSPPVASRVLDQLDARKQAATIEHADQAELDLTATTPANVVRRQEGLW